MKSMVSICLTNPDQFPQIPNSFLWYSLFNNQLQNQQPPSKKALTLREFVNDYWLPLEIETESESRTRLVFTNRR